MIGIFFVQFQEVVRILGYENKAIIGGIMKVDSILTAGGPCLLGVVT
jgi:hypothetical protein